jgi:hypothetical protein
MALCLVSFLLSSSLQLPCIVGHDSLFSELLIELLWVDLAVNYTCPGFRDLILNSCSVELRLYASLIGYSRPGKLIENKSTCVHVLVLVISISH